MINILKKKRQDWKISAQSRHYKAEINENSKTKKINMWKWLLIYQFRHTKRKISVNYKSVQNTQNEAWVTKGYTQNTVSDMVYSEYM